eukprot:gene6238-biopygen20843
MATQGADHGYPRSQGVGELLHLIRADVAPGVLIDEREHLAQPVLVAVHRASATKRRAGGGWQSTCVDVGGGRMPQQLLASLELVRHQQKANMGMLANYMNDVAFYGMTYRNSTVGGVDLHRRIRFQQPWMPGHAHTHPTDRARPTTQEVPAGSLVNGARPNFTPSQRFLPPPGVAEEVLDEIVAMFPGDIGEDTFCELVEQLQAETGLEVAEMAQAFKGEGGGGASA